MNKVTLETQKGAYSAMNQDLEEAVKSVLRAYGLEEKDFEFKIKKNNGKND